MIWDYFKFDFPMMFFMFGFYSASVSIKENNESTEKQILISFNKRVKKSTNLKYQESFHGLTNAILR